MSSSKSDLMSRYADADDMMRIEYDPRLVEHAVFLAASRDPQIEADLHDAIDPLYTIPAGRVRENAFQKQYALLFVRFGLDRVISNLLAEYPIITASIEGCIVRDTVRRSAESAELFVRKIEGSRIEQKTLIIQVAAASLLEVKNLQHLLRRELLHVADMLDPVFEYTPPGFDGTPARQNLMRDRYRLLWDIYVEARLWRQDMSDQRSVSRLKDIYGRLFADEGEGALDFDAVFNAPQSTHPQLVNRATQLPAMRPAAQSA